MHEIYDIIVIGAGTAGMTAAIYGQRAGKQVLMIEEGMYGGQIINTPEVENYPGVAKIPGFQFAMNLFEQASALGAKLESGRVTGITSVSTDGKPIFTVSMGEQNFQGKTVILATGAKNRKLGLSNEQALTGRGVSYCATCDGAFYRDKTVAVVGGGNTALEDAEYLADICKQVYIIHRREEFRGESGLANRVSQKPTVTLAMNAVVTGLIGEGHLEQVEIEDVRTKERKQLSVDGVFVAIGQEPDNGAFADLVEIDEQGYIVAGEDCKTATPGIFVAGDCRTKTVRQLTTAAADGAVAALAAVSYMNYNS